MIKASLQSVCSALRQFKFLESLFLHAATTAFHGNAAHSVSSVQRSTAGSPVFRFDFFRFFRKSLNHLQGQLSCPPHVFPLLLTWCDFVEPHGSGCFPHVASELSYNSVAGTEDNVSGWHRQCGLRERSWDRGKVTVSNVLPPLPFVPS